MAFCPQCNAPQIRVTVAERALPSERPLERETLAYFDSSLPGRIQWSRAWPATALAAFIGALLMLTPAGILGLGMLVGGLLSVIFYRRRSHGARVTTGMGLRLGIVTGMLGFVMLAVPTMLASALFDLQQKIQTRIVEAVSEAAARSADPQAQQVVELVKTPQGVALFLALAVILSFMACVIFSALGGALGAAFFRRKEPF